MPRFYGKFFGLKLKGEFTKTLDNELQILNRKAARAFVKAVIKRVPVWTGLALGTVKFAKGPNGNLAEYLNVSIPIVPYERARVTAKKNQFQGGRYGHYSFSSSRHIYRFTFNSNLIYFIHNDFFSRPEAGQHIVAPWRSMVYGRYAYNLALAAGIRELPKIQKYIVSNFNKAVIVGG